MINFNTCRLTPDNSLGIHGMLPIKFNYRDAPASMRGSITSNLRKETPRILSDIPHLYSEENGRKLGQLLF